MEKMSRRDFLLVAPGALAASAALPAETKTYPVRPGVDDSRLSGDAPPAQVSQFFEILQDLGLDHVDIHLRPITGAGDQNALLMAQRIQPIDPTLRQHGMTYTLDVEAPNFSPSAEITQGINEYNHLGGLHRWDFRTEWLKAVLPPAAPSPPAFQGLVYGECGHVQLSNNEFSNPPRLTCQSGRPRIGAEGAFAPHGQSHRSSLLDTAMRWPLGWGCSLCGREDPAWPPRRTRGDYGAGAAGARRRCSRGRARSCINNPLFGLSTIL